jgi:large repetitive protein
VAGSPYAIKVVYTSDSINFLGNSGLLAGGQAVNKATLTVTANPNSKTYGQAVTESGSISGAVNGDGITASFSSPGDAASAPVGTGSYTISATLSDPNNKLSNYAVQQTTALLTVKPRRLTITARNQSKTYGAALNLGSTAFTVGAGQLVNGDRVTIVTLSSPGAPATAAVAGSPYKITPSNAQGSGLANYAITYAPGLLTVNRKVLIITALDQTRDPGAANPLFPVVYSGFVLGQGPGVLGGTLVVSTTATVSSMPGSYPIIPGGLTSANYVIRYVWGTLTILDYRVGHAYSFDW